MNDIEQVSVHWHLGIQVDSELKWESHIDYISKSIAKNIYLLSRLTSFTSPEACLAFFNAHVMSKVNYVSNVWDNCAQVHLKKLESAYIGVQ